jgi:hypothetical protein
VRILATTRPGPRSVAGFGAGRTDVGNRTTSAIARHTNSDRKTVRKYLAGDGQPGVRARPDPDPFDPFVDSVTARLTEDPHLWARTLFDELDDLGFALSYQRL